MKETNDTLRINYTFHVEVICCNILVVDVLGAPYSSGPKWELVMCFITSKQVIIVETISLYRQECGTCKCHIQYVPNLHSARISLHPTLPNHFGSSVDQVYYSNTAYTKYMWLQYFASVW